VADFGCGGGIDVILAAHKVGPQGRVIGIDFAPEMIERAKQAIEAAGLQDRDIELGVADMASTRLPESRVDVVISNCVINLIPDKAAVYQEAFRILKPGGRVAISDIVLTDKIDPELKERFQATWPGCLGGAIPEDEYLNMIREAGFAEVQIVSRHLLTPVELEAMACCPGEKFTTPPAKEDLFAVQGKVSSIKFRAIKQLH
jgi:SAM-dependent methyltransferase